VVGAVGGKPVRLAKVSARLAQGLPANDEAVRQDLSMVEASSYEFQLHRTIVMRAVAQVL
jgi:hypothetical protein